MSDRWLSEVQAFFESLRDSTTFWVVGGIAAFLFLCTLLRGGRRRG